MMLDAGTAPLMMAAVGSVLAAAAALLAVSRNRTRSLAFLVGVSGGLFGAQIAQVHVFLIFAALWLIARATKDGRIRLSFAAVAAPLACAPIALTASFGDLVNHWQLALQLLALAIGAAFIASEATAEDRSVMLYGLLLVCTVASMYADLQVVGVLPRSTWHLDVSALGRPTAFYPEPDWMGMFAGIGALLAWRLPLRRWVRVVAFVACLLALLFAFARAAWIGFVIAVIVAVAVGAFTDYFPRILNPDAPRRGRTAHRGRATALAVSALGLIAAVMAFPSLAADLDRRLGGTLIAQSNDISAQARVAQNRSLWFLARTAPWYGHGISASGRVDAHGRIGYGSSESNVGSNWLLSLWVDAGLLAVPLLILLIVAIVLAIRTSQGLLLVYTLVCCIFSNAFFEPIVWLLLGLALSAISERRRQRGTAGETLGRHVVVAS